MKLFTQSYELNIERKTETYILQCRKMLNKQKQTEESTKQNKAETPVTPEEPATPTPTAPNPVLDQDKECQNILGIKDYYEILGVANTAEENEIKKAYKKVKI